MKHTELLQALIDNLGYQSYLEIGIEDGKNFNALTLGGGAIKVGIDPAKKSRRVATHPMTSDAYFDKYPSQTFDLVFIDGLHEADQVLRDVNHALTVLNDGGTIVCHDLNPGSYQRQVVPRAKGSGAWLGDCWKAWVALRRRANLSMFVVDTDYGCGIIRRRHPRSSIGPFPLPLTSAPLHPDFKGLQAHREEWLNLVPLATFQGWLTSLSKKTPHSSPAPAKEPVSLAKEPMSLVEETPKKSNPLTSKDVVESAAKLQPRVPQTRKTNKNRGK